jgi:hypothetical protein
MAKSNLIFFRPGFVVSAALVLLGLVLGFGLIGISVARESGHPQAYLWIPGLLAAASAVLIIGILLRLVRRAFSSAHRR